MPSESEYAEERSRLFEETLKKATEGVKIDCRRGCTYCCYGVTLWIKRVEAVLMVDFLNRLPLKERKEIWHRIKNYAKLYEEEAKRVGYVPGFPIKEEDLDIEKLGVIGGLGMNEVPCPFLEECTGVCLIYEARPDMCRLMLYENSSVCKRDWENPLGFLWKREIAPFMDDIKARFFPRWKLKRGELSKKFPSLEQEKLEGEVGFVTHFIRFDPVRKVFKVTG